MRGVDFRLVGHLTMLVALAPAPVRAACEKDTDCKGERVCVRGECTDPADGPQPGAGAGVRVTIESNVAEATLARVASTGFASASGPGGSATAHSVGYEMVCTVPCDKVLDRNFRYVVQNVPAMYGTVGPFTLPAQPEVTLKVEAGSSSAWSWGLVGMFTGGTVSATGVPLLIAGLAADHDELTTTGAVMSVIGLPMLVAGIWAMAANGTEVRTGAGDVLAGDAGPDHRPTGPGTASTVRGLGWSF